MIRSYLKLGSASILFFLSINIHVLAQTTLLPVKVDGLWGYIDRKGEIAIKPQYQNARGFSEALAAVSDRTIPGKCGYITDAGYLVIDMRFDYCGDFYEGLAAVGSGGKYGYINKEGNYVISLRWQNASRFSDQMARVTVGALDAVRYGFIDHKGVIAIKPYLIYSNDFHDDLALAAISGNTGLKIGFLDRQGKWKIKPRFGSATDFSEGYACVTKEGTSSLFEGSLLYDQDVKDPKAYYIDKNGKRAFPGDFDSCGPFSEGLAAVEINDSWHLIDKAGQITTATTFPDSSDVAIFSEGLAAVNMGAGAKFIDKSGKTVLQTAFDWADNFINGIARVKRVQKNGTVSFGYIDSDGRVIWEPSE